MIPNLQNPDKGTAVPLERYTVPLKRNTLNRCKQRLCRKIIANVKNAQLIISSHADSLLSLDHLRRDQFYFVDKNNETAASELYSLDEFSPRKTENIRNAYMLGRYGAVPVLKEGIDLK